MIEIRDEQKEISVRDEANICANDISSLLETAFSWSDIEPLIRKRAKAILDRCAIGDGEVVVHCNREENAKIIAHILEFDSQNMVYDWYEQHIANIAKYYEEKLNSPENPDSSEVHDIGN